MIVPMKKISLVVMGDKKREALKKLRKAGIVHIEITEGSGKKIDELKEQIALLESAVFLLSEKKNKNIEQKDITASEAVSAAKEITSLAEKKKAYLHCGNICFLSVCDANAGVALCKSVCRAI